MRRTALTALALCGLLAATKAQAQEPNLSPQTVYDAVKDRTTVTVSTGYLKPLPAKTLVDASYSYGGKTAGRPANILLCFFENHPDTLQWRNAPGVAVRYGDEQGAYAVERKEVDTLQGQGGTPTSYHELIYIEVPTSDFLRMAQADTLTFQIAQTTVQVDKDHLAPFKKLAALIPASVASYRRADTSVLPPAAAEALKKVALPSPPLDTPLPAKPQVILQTSKGPITLELDSAAAPLHVRSFLYLVSKGFYDGTQFHRFADLTGDGGNIIQGGDPLSKSADTKEYVGLGGPGYEIPLEISNLKHDALTIAAARSSDPDSAGSQFYICQAPVHFLDGKYTVFGKVVAGQDAALKLRQDDSITSARVVK